MKLAIVRKWKEVKLLRASPNSSRRRCAAVLVLSSLLWACISSHEAHKPGAPAHHTHSGFRNPAGSPERQFSWHSLWFFPSRPFAQLFDSKVPAHHVVAPEEAIKQFDAFEGLNSITWIGHMTAVIRLEGQVIVTDPWFTDYATGVPPFGPHRKMAPGIALQQLPQIDTVVISHNHYDHLDIATLERLPHPEKITLVVPLRLGKYVEHIPFKEVVELDWYESVSVNAVEYTALPVVHFSARGLTDTNQTLWAGFSIRGIHSDKRLFYFEGDYGEIYRRIGDECGPFDIVMLAVGAYEPRALMKGSHCVPATCAAAAIDLQAKTMVPVHWGTTVLGSEDIYESGTLFQQAAEDQGVESERIWIMKIGETRAF